VYDEAQEAGRQKRDYRIEFRIVLPDGTVKHLESIGHHLLSARGELVEVIGTNVDDTERKRLQQMQSDFAHMHRISMMGELAASLSHEITQPIASARNNARAALNFLDKKALDLDEIREAIDCVVADTDRAREIIDRIRDQMKKAPPQFGLCDLNSAISEVIILARSAILQNGVSVQTRLSEGLSPVRGDRVQLQQVGLNLILNAIEAMGSTDAGARELLVTTEQDHKGVLVAVRDSGPGIDPAHLERVFDTFYTTKSKGMGMGLSICRSIIDGHGGKLWAAANKPRGTVFQFTLPCAVNQSAPTK
jgi:C4-dicarboxylate-specific signal transduction histidine kinase